ncbi:hypothetical protein ARMA_1343 [Ardenticatena maritima]|uniref:Uncharacterized protein n=1 Tax=Ardenticatena maritima TaxID=872965 RepID=A0A0M8K8D6_9CHLR|nr:hypothetical protein ARMA_1343 [Ardenticatena maritima]
MAVVANPFECYATHLMLLLLGFDDGEKMRSKYITQAQKTRSAEAET